MKKYTNKILLFLLCALITLPSNAFSISSVVKSYTFSNGTNANATEVNANFDVIVTGVNSAIGAINTAAGSKTSLDNRLDVSINDDGTVKSAITAGNEWINPELSPTYVSTNSFTVTGDQEDIYVAYRRLKIKLAASLVYTHVESSVYSSVSGLTTVTVHAGTLTNPITTVDHSIITPVGTFGASTSALDIRSSTGYEASVTNVGSTLVVRTANGSFDAGTITASFVGDVTGTASNASALENHTTLDILAHAYPVGSIYLNASVSTNPATLLGFGTWTAVGAGRMLLGKGGGYSAGATGGEATHTLTEAEMPAHTHTFGGGANDFKQSTQVSNGGGPFVPATGVANNAGSGGSAGSGAAHNNMPPYLVVYMWVRTL